MAAATYGTLGGFTTMVANAAGPVMSMYFLASRFPVKEFLGTAAWFFAIVNIAKVPFSVGPRAHHPARTAARPGARSRGGRSGRSVGRWLAGRLDQVLFERLVIGFTVVGALYLLF